jgi:hypothetical protein
MCAFGRQAHVIVPPRVADEQVVEHGLLRIRNEVAEDTQIGCVPVGAAAHYLLETSRR